MTPQEITDVLRAKFKDKLTAAHPADKHPRVHTTADHWREIAQYLRRDPALSFDWLACLTGIDYVADAQFCVAYDFWSSDHRHRFAVKVYAPRVDRATFPSVADLWPTADWHEREAAEMFGLAFDHHPDPRNLLLADDWVGFPLRKDYVFPREYHGIPGSVELDWQQKPD
ncbi:MAG TPA: NADH-quinone oxidoreductase subunit C [Tepidisphaeraceae bacterium]|nr:NADH-quinone oxidoreductase subunit C [Tepidisphaeraceae bacterium]